MLRTESMLFEHCTGVICVASAWHGMPRCQQVNSNCIAAGHIVTHICVYVAFHLVYTSGR